MTEQPLSPASDGRGPGGRFGPGNTAGKGNPFAKRVNELRSALFDACTVEDLRAVVLAMIDKAKAGDVAAIKELLQRLIGPPEALDVLERLEQIEARIEAMQEHRR